MFDPCASNTCTAHEVHCTDPGVSNCDHKPCEFLEQRGAPVANHREVVALRVSNCSREKDRTVSVFNQIWPILEHFSGYRWDDCHLVKLDEYFPNMMWVTKGGPKVEDWSRLVAVFSYPKCRFTVPDDFVSALNKLEIPGFLDDKPLRFEINRSWQPEGASINVTPPESPVATSKKSTGRGANHRRTHRRRNNAQAVDRSVTTTSALVKSNNQVAPL